MSKPVRGTQLNRTHPLSRGLVGAWLFNEGTGAVVNDLGGYRNNGTLEDTTVTWDSGQDGACLQFPLSSGVGVDCGASPNTNFTTEDFTIVAKIYHVGSAQDAWGKIVAHGQYTIDGWTLSVNDSTNKDAIALGISQSGAFQTVQSSNGVLTNNGWNTIAAVRTGSTAKLYHDGLEVSGYATTDTLIDPTASVYNLRFGRRSNTTNQAWNGKISWVYIFNRALFSAEIAWLYLNPYAMFEYGISLALLYAAATTGTEYFPAMQDPSRGFGAVRSARLGGILQ